jgi:chemotaxis protein CheX
VHQQFLAARGHPLRVEASQVERIGGLGLQVLVAAKAAWAADGHSLVVKHMSRELEAGLGLLGVQPGFFADGEG